MTSTTIKRLKLDGSAAKIEEELEICYPRDVSIDDLPEVHRIYTKKNPAKKELLKFITVTDGPCKKGNINVKCEVCGNQLGKKSYTTIKSHFSSCSGGRIPEKLLKNTLSYLKQLLGELPKKQSSSASTLKKLESSSNLKQQTILGLLNSEEAKQEALIKVCSRLFIATNQPANRANDEYLVEFIDQITKINPSATTISALNGHAVSDCMGSSRIDGIFPTNIYL
jgi:hypothetical protein